jgi:hypothetical protein
MPIISLSFGPYTSPSQLPSPTLPPLFPVLGKVKHSLFGLAQPFGSLSSTAAKGTPCFHNFSIGNDLFTVETDTARALWAPHSQQLPTHTRLVCGNCLTGAARGTARQHCIRPSWASNNAPSKDLSNMRALQHLAPLATDYWATHSSIEPGHSRFGWKFEKIVSVSKFLAGRMHWGLLAAGWKRSGLRWTLNSVKG